tara:strand:+ start:211 stop:639 length:429 start_codon:yes stop_codon:yes gene_type:complete
MLETEYECLVCGFQLWNPVASLPNTLVGLYDDARFPGRCLVSYRTHLDDLTEFTPEQMAQFMTESMRVSRAIKTVTGCARVNFAVLGNAVQHVHAHLIPRYPDTEDLPHRAPWSDPRKQIALPDNDKQRLIHQIQQQIEPRP